MASWGGGLERRVGKEGWRGGLERRVGKDGWRGVGEGLGWGLGWGLGRGLGRGRAGVGERVGDCLRFDTSKPRSESPLTFLRPSGQIRRKKGGGRGGAYDVQFFISPWHV